MFSFQDLFQWDRFITPTLIKPFYTIALVVAILLGLSGIFTGLSAMAISPFGGFLSILVSIIGTIVAVMFLRVACEFVLIVFRVNEHLGAIRDQSMAP